MRKHSAISLTGTMLFAISALSAQLVAKVHPGQNRHTHYKVIDTGTSAVRTAT